MKKYLFLLVPLIISMGTKGQLMPVKAKIRPYETVITPDAVAYRGLFTIYAVRDSFFLELPDTLFNREIQVINRMVKGPASGPAAPSLFGGGRQYPGEELGEKTVYFDMGPDSLILLHIDEFNNDQAKPGDRLATAVANIIYDPIHMYFPIVALGKGHAGYVIDVTGFLKGDGIIKGSNIVTQPGRTGNWGSNYHVEYIHAYPLNMEIGIYQILDKEKVLVSNTSFILLPKEPMQQRLRDRRVGFFASQSFNYFADDQHQVEERQFIFRWRLEPRPEDRERWLHGELVEPAKPIIYYIDPSTPKQWVKYLVQGVSDWQKAFEQAGFKNAIQGREWPYGDSIDLNDARYSVICYLPSETENAYGPQVHDPRSGEIIQTHIGWYHNVMALLRNWYMIQASISDPRARKVKFDDNVMGELIRFVSSHEVGHTLGLAHNQGSSSQTPVEKMRDKEWLKIHGHTASIMDYARFNYVAQPEDNIPPENLWPHIGEYDRWAIQWGYGYPRAADPAEDKKIMGLLATDSLAANPRLWFGTEEGEGLPILGTPPNDPRCQNEALGDNNMAANTYGIKNLKRVLSGLAAWSHEEGGKYDELGELYGEVLTQYKRYTRHVLTYIGGVQRTWKSEEDTGDVYVPVSKAEQQQAIAFLNNELFVTPAWLMDHGIMNKVVDQSNGGWVGALQLSTLRTLLDASTLGKISANALRFGPGGYPLDEYLGDVHKYIWGGLASGRRMDEYRRNLQKNYVNDLSGILQQRSSVRMKTEVWCMARTELINVQKEIDAVLPKYPNGPDREHLESLAFRIKKIFNLNPFKLVKQ